MNIADKVVVVTGAGSRMGREIALELLRRRARVAAVDVRESSLRETAALAPRGTDALATYVMNVTDRAAVEALPQAVVKRFGSVDGIINCAGIIQPFVRLNDLDYAAIDRVFDVNWRGTLYMTKTFSRGCSSGPRRTWSTSRAWAASCRCPARPPTARPRPQ